MQFRQVTKHDIIEMILTQKRVGSISGFVKVPHNGVIQVEATGQASIVKSHERETGERGRERESRSRNRHQTIESQTFEYNRNRHAFESIKKFVPLGDPGTDMSHHPDIITQSSSISIE